MHVAFHEPLALRSVTASNFSHHHCVNDQKEVIAAAALVATSLRIESIVSRYRNERSADAGHLGASS
jgi:hypothetical protein